MNIKTEAEIQKMRIAGRIAAETLEMIGQYVQAGVTTAELDQICHDFIVNEKGSIPAALNYQGFPKSVCTSVNHQICHGIPGPRKLKNGDAINIDVAVIKDEYYGDTSKMFFVGKPNVLTERLVKVTQECLYLAISLVKPGVRLGDIGAIIQKHAEANRFTVVHEFCGHGLGKIFHDDPNVLHFGKAGTGEELPEGLTFTIEPMINAGSRHMKILPDGWTAVTKDHKPSAQWEHSLLITKDGCEILTLREEEDLDFIFNIKNML